MPTNPTLAGRVCPKDDSRRIVLGVARSSACRDCADVLQAAATVWQRAGGSFSDMLRHQAAQVRLESLGRRYRHHQRRQSPADAAHLAATYPVTTFEHIFSVLLD